MDNQTISKLKKPRSSLWKRVAPALGIGFVLGFCLFAFAYITGIGPLLWYSWKFVEISADEIPIYPNAQNIIHEESVDNTLEIGTWKFTTNDDPETVWKFYVDEMGRRWDFFEWPLLPESSRRLIVRSCPAYEFDMTSTSIDAMTYGVTIQLSYDPCR